ncbi:MHYT domain-containing protein, partial [Legionella sp.]|uniref:MHYT domain-containing protein n=1 Tax=Legionella sp. TaxID=459 RepID=UPI003D0CAAF7
MYTEFFQPNALPLDQLKGVYDSRLVILSYLIAVMASYVALDLAGRLRDHNNTP